MGILTRLAEHRSQTLKMNSGDPALSDYFGGNLGSNSGQVVNENSALTVSTVYACVKRKASTLAMLPLNIMERMKDGSREVAENHRLYNLLHNQANKWQTSYDWRLMMHGHLQLRGNAYSQIVYHPGRKRNELVPMAPERMWPFMVDKNGTANFMSATSPAPDEGDVLWYQYFTSGGAQIVLPASEVLHLRGYSTNGIVGKNVVQLMREAVGISMATEEQGARLFSNGAQIGKIFSHENTIGDVTYERLKKELNANTVGTSNAHKSLILEDGMKMHQTTLTMEDAQFLETRKFQVEDIASFLDVPLILINRSGDKNQTFASAEHIISIFVKFMMHPDFICWEQTLNKDLLYESERNTYYVDFDFDALLRGDTKARAEYLSKMFDMASISPDDINIYEGRSPTGTEEGKKYYLGSGRLPVEMAGKNVNVGVEPNKNLEEDEENEDGEEE